MAAKGGSLLVTLSNGGVVSVDDDPTGSVDVACSVGCGLVSDGNNCTPAKQYTISVLDIITTV